MIMGGVLVFLIGALLGGLVGSILTLVILTGGE